MAKTKKQKNKKAIPNSSDDKKKLPSTLEDTKQSKSKYLDKILTPTGLFFTFIAWVIITIIILELIIQLRIQDENHFLIKILTEQLAPNTICLFTALMGVYLTCRAYKKLKADKVFGSLPKLTDKEKIPFWLRTSLIGFIIILLAVRFAILIIMSIHQMPLPNNLSYKTFWLIFLKTNVVSFICLYVMLIAPFYNFQKLVRNPLWHTRFFVLYVLLGLGIFFIPIVSAILGKNVWG